MLCYLLTNWDKSWGQARKRSVYNYVPLTYFGTKVDTLALDLPNLDSLLTLVLGDKKDPGDKSSDFLIDVSDCPALDTPGTLQLTSPPYSCFP